MRPGIPKTRMLSFGILRFASSSSRLRTNNLGCDSRVPSCQGLRCLRLRFLDGVPLRSLALPQCSMYRIFPTSGSEYLTTGFYVVLCTTGDPY